jgi:hypothetical protein
VANEYILDRMGQVIVKNQVECRTTGSNKRELVGKSDGVHSVTGDQKSRAIQFLL